MPEPVTPDRPRERDTRSPRGREPSPRPLLRTILGRVLRQTRWEQGRTLAEVARAARVSMPYLSELERGRKEASSEVLAAVSEALEIDLADLLTEAGRRLAAGSTGPTPVVQARPVTQARPAPANRSAPVARAGSGTVVRLADFRSRRARPAPAPSQRGPGQVVLLRAA